MKNEFYPIQFEPIFKDRIWGGKKLKTELNKPISSAITGESWEISTVENDISVVQNGQYKGKKLTDLIDLFPNEILGNSVIEKFGKQFPLLFKYLDAREDLSIQVHPNDELAKKRHNSFGKTEMWYVIQADQDSKIIVGFKENSNQEQYLENLKNNTLLSILDTINVKKGDSFFLETGTIHAIGAGLVIAEIQQTSDITYRLYDFDRTDASGNKRELHVDLALEAINYNKVDSKKEFANDENKSNSIVNCQYFSTNFIPLNGAINFVNNGDTFRVLMCTDGFFEISTTNFKSSYKKGDTILLPAALKKIEIKGIASVLEIYIS